MKLDVFTDFDCPIKGPLCRRAVIMFNGQYEKYVVEADEETGLLRRYKQVDGRFEADENHNCVIEALQGKVKIIDPDNVILADVYLK